MKNKNIIFIIILILSAAGGWFFLTNHPFEPIGHRHEAKRDIYYCPMHPQITSDRPGNCPICSMQLVKREKNNSTISTIKGGEGAVPGYAPVSLDTRQRQFIGVKTAAVQKKTLTKTIHAYGYVAHDLDLYNAQLEYIDAWHAYYPFLARRPVKDEYRQDWREYYAKPSAPGRWRSDEKLKASQRLIKAEYELTHMGLTQTQIAQLREVKYGQPWIQPDLLFFEEGHPLWVYAQIPESDLGFVDVGQKAVVTITNYAEKTEGIVRSVSLMVDPETRTTLVRVELPGYKGDLKVNLFADVDFSVELDESLTVPIDAILDTGLQKIVFIQTQNGIFEPRRIQTGFEGDGMVAVKSGLNAGDMIVVSGNFLLDSESRMQASLMGGQSDD